MQEQPKKKFSIEAINDEILVPVNGVPAFPNVPNVPTVPAVPKGIRASELYYMEFPPIDYIVEGILTIGLHCIGGRPKQGKSWFALQLAISIATGEQFLREYATIQSPVIYFALEDNRRRLNKRLNILRSEGNEMKELWFYTELINLDYGALDIIDKCIQETGAKLVIVDTVGKIRGTKRGKDNYQEDYREFGLLQKFALDREICLFVVMHTVKGGHYVDPFDCISGTTGITGAFDGMFVLKRENNTNILYGKGRDYEDFELALSFDKENDKWSVLGTPQEVRLSAERKAILEILQRGKPMKPKEIAEEGEEDFSPKSLRKILRKMLDDGLILQNDNGFYYPSGTVGTAGTVGTDGNTGTDQFQAF